MDLIDLADQVAAAADLDDQARDRVQSELEFGDVDYALAIAVLETRTPLPAGLQRQVRQGVDRWFSTDTSAQILAALDELSPK